MESAAPAVTRTSARLICLVAGAVLYAASFFLLAVGDMKGWACAWYSLAIISTADPIALLPFGAGLLNPLVVIYICCRIYNCCYTLRRILAILALPLMASSAIFIAILNRGSGSPKTDFAVHTGYFTWIAGMLLLLWGDLRPQTK